MSMLVRGGRWAHGHGRRTRSRRSAPRLPPCDASGATNILSFVLSRNNLGVAFLDVDSSEMRVVEVLVDEDFQVAAAIKDKCDPCAVVIPSSLSKNEPFLKAIFGAEAVSYLTDYDSDYFDSDDDDATTNRTGRTSRRVTGRTTGHSTGRTTGRTTDHSTGRSTGRSEVEDRQDEVEVLDDDLSVARNSPDETANAHDEPNVPFFTVRNSECTIDKSKQAVALIHLLSMPSNMTAKDRVAFLGFCFDQHELALRAFGAIISFAIDHNILLITEDLISLNSIEYGGLSSGLQMSTATAISLQVFQNDAHPAGGRSKQWGIYGLFGMHLRSGASFRLLKSWLRSPLTDVEAIVERQTVVDSFRSLSNQDFVRSIRDALRSVKDVKNILKRIRDIAANVNDWQSLFNSLKAFSIVLETFKSAARADRSLQRSVLCEKVKDIDMEVIRAIIGHIDSIIDFEESKAAKRLCVRDGFSHEVDGFRRCLAGLDSFLTRVAIDRMREIMAERSAGVGVELSSLNYRFETNIGFLVFIEEVDVDRLGIEQLGEAGFDFQYSTNEGFFFKDAKCIELDDSMGDVHGAIVDLESKVSRFLAAKITSIGQAAYVAAGVVAEIDCLQAFAAAAEEYRWVKPTLSQGQISLKDARHCLLEVHLPSFVPNSTEIRAGDVHVITGPNYSGKSVFLKTVAVIVILAQIGSCVPAESAVIVPVRAIFTRVTSFDSISGGQSTFFVDCSQVASFLQAMQVNNGNADRRQPPVLAILDEFGKGTSNIDGVSLLGAVLNAVLKHEDNAFICMCATHQVEVFQLLPMEHPKLNAFSMEMVCPEETETGSSKVRKSVVNSSPRMDQSWAYIRTFRLLKGIICSESRAVQCALEQGVTRELLGRAMRIKEVASVALPSGSTSQSTDTYGNEIRLDIGIRKARVGTGIRTLAALLNSDLIPPPTSRSHRSSRRETSSRG